jgi:hypothetical protein
MNISKTRILLTVVVSLTLLVGCSGKKVRRYDITLSNNSEPLLQEVFVSFDKFKDDSGYLPPSKGKGRKTYMYVHEEHPEIPEKATVGWTTPDGKKHTADVEVKSKMPPGDSNLNIIFTINADNTVTVSYE